MEINHTELEYLSERLTEAFKGTYVSKTKIDELIRDIRYSKVPTFVSVMSLVSAFFMLERYEGIQDYVEIKTIDLVQPKGSDVIVFSIDVNDTFQQDIVFTGNKVMEGQTKGEAAKLKSLFDQIKYNELGLDYCKEKREDTDLMDDDEVKANIKFGIQLIHEIEQHASCLRQGTTGAYSAMYDDKPIFSLLKYVPALEKKFLTPYLPLDGN